MKILMLNRSYYPNVGGIENSLYYMSRALVKQGHEVAIFTQEVAYEYEEREEFAEIIRYPRKDCNKLLLPVSPYVECANAVEDIKKEKERLEADLVICRDPMLGVAYKKVFPSANTVYIPAVIIKYYNKGIRPASTFLGYIKEVLRFLQLKIQERQQKRIMELSDKVVVFSKNVKDQIIVGRVCKAEKVVVCPPGVADSFSKCTEEDVPRDETTFVFVGRLCREKNLFMLIDAFHMLNCKNKKLLLVGDGDLREQLERKVQELSLQEKVVFTGKTNEPIQYYKRASFFVLPSYYESFGQVIIEALACGLPVIGFPTIKGHTMTAIDELIREGQNGFVCSGFGEEYLAAAMKKAAMCFEDKNTYFTMRKYCREYAEKTFSWERLTKLCISKEK